jgi:hypothetical protein
MTTNTNTNSISKTYGNSNVLTLQSLIKQYNNTLTEYQQVYQSYLNSLSFSKSDKGFNRKKEFSFVPNTAFWGTAGISQKPASTVVQCSNLCVANSSCSGATFDPSNNYCWLRSGEGSTVPSTTNQMAIIPATREYMMTLKSLNSRLTDINNQIIQMSKNMIVTNVQMQNQVSSKTLQDNYNQLLKDRKMIQEITANHDTLTGEVNDSDLVITHSYTYYLFILLLFLFILYLFFRFVIFSTGGSEKSESMMGGSYSFDRFFKKHLLFLFRK